MPLKKSSHLYLLDSVAINRALEILTPALVDKFVDDEELAVLIKDGLGISPTTGETDFNYGKGNHRRSNHS